MYKTDAGGVGSVSDVKSAPLSAVSHGLKLFFFSLFWFDFSSVSTSWHQTVKTARYLHIHLKHSRAAPLTWLTDGCVSEELANQSSKHIRQNWTSVLQVFKVQDSIWDIIHMVSFLGNVSGTWRPHNTIQYNAESKPKIFLFFRWNLIKWWSTALIWVCLGIHQMKTFAQGR